MELRSADATGWPAKLLSDMGSLFQLSRSGFQTVLRQEALEPALFSELLLTRFLMNTGLAVRMALQPMQPGSSVYRPPRLDVSTE